MAHFPSEEYPKFEIEIYPSGWAYSNNWSNFQRMLISPEDRFSSGISSSHYKIINQIPDYISDYYTTDTGTEQFGIKNGTYKITLKLARSWDISGSNIPSSQAEAFNIAKYTGTGTVTQKNQATTIVEDTGYEISTGYRVLSYDMSQIIEVSGAHSTRGLAIYNSMPNYSSNSANPSDLNLQQMYYHMTRVELLEGKTV